VPSEAHTSKCNIPLLRQRLTGGFVGRCNVGTSMRQSAVRRNTAPAELSSPAPSTKLHPGSPILLCICASAISERECIDDGPSTCTTNSTILLYGSFLLLNVTVSSEPMNVSKATRQLVCLYAFNLHNLGLFGIACSIADDARKMNAIWYWQ